MKRLILAVLISIILFAACSSQRVDKDEAEKLLSDFALKAVLIQNGEEYKVRIERNQDTDFRLTFLSGEVIAGLSVEFEDDKTLIHFDGLTIATTIGRYIELGILKKAITDFSFDAAERSDNQWSHKVSFDGRRVRSDLVFDRATSRLASVTYNFEGNKTQLNILNFEEV